MIRSDSQSHQTYSSLSNISNLTIDVISKIEKDLTPYDLVSVVFLLYDTPDTALQRLTVYQRVCNNAEGRNLNLLYDWANHAQNRSSWRYEFLEALAICRLYNIINKLGLEIKSVKKHYLPHNINTSIYINPMKKVLYKICENVTKDGLKELQNALKTYDYDTTEYKTCELVFLELICSKFIFIDSNNIDGRVQVDNVANIIQYFAGLEEYAIQLREIQNRLNDETNPVHARKTSKTPVVVNEELEESKVSDEKYTANFDDVYGMLNELSSQENTLKNYKSDTSKLNGEAYPIKNAKRVGVCYIINQEDFHLSKQNIESKNQLTKLDSRRGSTNDRIVLEKTMESLNFEVICHKNVNHKKMIELIKSIIEYRIHHDDSVFMLCILSHGVKGHVYAADSVKVKIEDIQNLLDKGFCQRKLDIPKVMILQACQVNDEDDTKSMSSLVADGPGDFYLRKSHFLVYWATAPELEAYRHEKRGSIFIHILCHLLQKHAKSEHLYDIFTKVTDGVAQLCTKLQRDQVPLFESTLRKKLYLQIPK